MKVYAVPFVGELGHELIFWQAMLRWVKLHKFKKDHMVVGCLRGHDILYEFADEILHLPTDFINSEEIHGQVCWSLRGKEEAAKEWMKETSGFNDKDTVYNPTVHSQTRYRHGYCDLYHKRHLQTFILLQGSNKGIQKAIKLLPDFDSWRLARYIVVYPRFKKGPGIVTLRNWRHWKSVVLFLESNFPDHRIVVAGVEGLVDDEIRGLGVDAVVPIGNMDLDLQVALLGNAAFSVVPISGCTFLSLLAGCPTFVVGTKKLMHHVIYRNIFQTKMTYFHDNGSQDGMPSKDSLPGLFSNLVGFGNSCVDGRFVV